MGPNGNRVNLPLSAAIMGNPNYEVTEGDILFDGESILDLKLTNVHVSVFPRHAIPS